ncbi:MAG TPA: hypothetical protein DIC34_04990 [Treponema sp.]|nr:MAG: hypothetical protein A2001_00180 [Treponema sp. GWC1_61_84]HCM25893.1 hypothetical protein [Treponema sp.]
MKTIRNIGLFAITASVLMCCVNASLPSASDTRAGTVSISIPALGAAFLSATGVENGVATSRANAAEGSEGRAYIAVSSVRLELFAPAVTAPIDTWEMNESAYESSAVGGTGSFVQSRNIAPGQGYTIKATFFNKANGGDDASRATVQGVSAPFDIVSGTCSYVLIVCRPLSAVVLSEGTASEAISLAPFEGSYEELSDIVAGGEKWFSFAATSRTTRVAAYCAEGSQAVPAIFVYDTDAVSAAVTTARSAGAEPGEGCVSYVSTVIGQTYYVGAVDLGSFRRKSSYEYQSETPDPAGDHSFTVLFGNAAEDEFESDDTLATARPLALGIGQIHSLYPSDDVDYVSFTAVKDTEYEVTTSSADSTVTSTKVEIFNAADELVSTSITEHQWTEGFTSIASWVCPEDGTYYARIGKGYGSMGGYRIVIESKIPAVELNVAVSPGIADPHGSLLVSWDPVTGAQAYQLWVSIPHEGGMDGPYQVFADGEELLPEGGALAEDRMSYETPPWFESGATAIVQVSYRIGGQWVSPSIGVEGTTDPETTISVVIE